MTEGREGTHGRGVATEPEAKCPAVMARPGKHTHVHTRKSYVFLPCALSYTHKYCTGMIRTPINPPAPTQECLPTPPAHRPRSLTIGGGSHLRLHAAAARRRRGPHTTSAHQTTAKSQPLAAASTFCIPAKQPQPSRPKSPFHRSGPPSEPDWGHAHCPLLNPPPPLPPSVA